MSKRTLPANDATTSHLSRRDFARLLGVGAMTLTFGNALSFGQSTPDATAQPAASLQGAGFYRFRRGDLGITLVNDGSFVMVPKQIFTNATQEQIVEAAKSAHVSPDGYPGQIGVVLLERGNDRILLDTGCGRLFGPTAGFLVPHLRRAGVAPEAITHVVLTHAHPDHIGGLTTPAGAPTFPNAKVFASRAEHAFWTTDPKIELTPFVTADLAKMVVTAAQAGFAAVKDRLALFEPGDTVAGLLQAIDAAGHTPGHVAFELAGDATNPPMLLLGDGIHLFPLQMKHPEWHIAFDADVARAAAARRMLLDRAATSSALTTAAHAPFPPAGYVDRDGDAFRWTPEPWAW